MTKSQENYLYTIKTLETQQGKVLSVDIANQLDITRASVSKAMKKLIADGYVGSDISCGVSLTAKGCQYASKLVERESIVSSFFDKVLGCDLEHCSDISKISYYFSDAAIERMTTII